jgi:chromosome segregation protein
LRLESAKQNLARVDDIFEEVTRQMNSLKRQAAKAERFAAVRDELRGRLRVVLASRMALMDAEQAGWSRKSPRLTERINVSAAEIAEQEASQHSLTERGYELDREGQEAQNRANEAAVELERATPGSAATPSASPNWKRALPQPEPSWKQTRTQLAGIAEERAQQHAFLESAAGEAKAFRQKVETRQQEARTAAEEVFTAERQLETNPPPRHASAHAGRQRPQPHGPG